MTSMIPGIEIIKSEIIKNSNGIEMGSITSIFPIETLSGTIILKQHQYILLNSRSLLILSIGIPIDKIELMESDLISIFNSITNH